MKPEAQQPNEQLASIIIDQLVKHKLIDNSFADIAKIKIQSGTVKPEEWRQWLTKQL